MFDSKKSWMVIAAIVIVYLIVVFSLPRTDLTTGTLSWKSGTIGALLNPHTESTTIPVPTTTAAPASATSGLTYEEATEIYAGFRFQFVTCHGTPGSMTLKKGNTFMLDNRDAKSHVIAVGSKSYTVGAYGFKIAAAQEVGTLNITCDGGGAAQIIVQP